jgi:galactose-1-phosphate uridylyltransferase
MKCYCGVENKGSRGSFSLVLDLEQQGINKTINRTCYVIRKWRTVSNKALKFAVIQPSTSNVSERTRVPESRDLDEFFQITKILRSGTSKTNPHSSAEVKSV